MAFCCGSLWNVLTAGCLRRSDRKIVKSTLYQSADTIMSRSGGKIPVAKKTSKKRVKKPRKPKKGVVVDELSSISVESQKISRKRERKNMEVRDDSSTNLTRRELGYVNEKFLRKNAVSEDIGSMGHATPKKAQTKAKQNKTGHLIELNLEREPPSDLDLPENKKKSSPKPKKKPKPEAGKKRKEKKDRKGMEKPAKIVFGDEENEILRKYRSSSYAAGPRNTQKHSIESSIDSEAETKGKQKNRKKDLSANIKKIEDIFRREANEDSESEISFIVDFYDRVDFNNNLKQKMYEVLNQNKRAEEGK
jgi:hypothetical protein